MIVLAVMIAPLALGGRAAAADPVIAAAGDIACDPNDSGYNGGAGTSDRCRQRATSDLLVDAGLARVLPLGDIQYDSASAANIAQVYDPTWGRVKSISRPIIGNHEGSGGAYFDYFNGTGAADGPAGPRGKGWYSFDVGGWHLVALNSNCDRVDCTAGSEQDQWLRADLASHRTTCTLAYWHHPRYSSGHDGSNTFMQPLWEALDDAGVELLLSGHSHNYERFAPLDRNGNFDRANGIRQFVVGTGGAFFTGGLDTLAPHSEVAQNHTFGVLFLTLRASSYEWEFIPEAGKTFSDAGTASCRGAPPPAPPRPTLTGTDPSSPANHNAPMVRGQAEAGSTVRIYDNAACWGTPVASGSAAAFSSPGLAVSVADDSSTTFHATASTGAGNASACSSSSITYIERSTSPQPDSDSDAVAYSGRSCPATSGNTATGCGLVGVFPPADTTAPAVTLAGRKSQRLGTTVRVLLTATTEDLWVTASGTASVRGASRVFRLKPVRDRMVTRGTKVVLRLKLSKTARQAIKRALLRRASVKVRVKLSMRDRAANVTTRRRAIGLSL